MELRSTLPASVAAFAAVILCFEAASAERRPEKVDFARDVYPIFERHCLECHGPQRQEGELRLDGRQAMAGGTGGRLVELYDADWDHHADLAKRLPAKCRDVDRGMAALVYDLKRRGLLDETLVIWGAEFGRTPLRQGVSGDGAKTSPGRDHHKDAFSIWLAGGGIKPAA